MGSAPEFTARIDSRNGIARVVLSGELDLATVPILEQTLSDVERDGTTIIMFDLRGLDYLDSTALHAFHGARSRADANGHQLIIIGVGSRARRLFELTGTEFLLDDRYAATVIDQYNGTAVPAAAQTTAGLVDADG